jgi:hypothetical protein
MQGAGVVVDIAAPPGGLAAFHRAVYGGPDMTTLTEWCAKCGHHAELHHPRCGGQIRTGPGDEYDGGDFTACRCDEFAALSTEDPDAER